MHFERLSSSWVAIHPQPLGVVQFIGGAFYGTLPTVNYRHFLNQLYQAGYTIIAFPFQFTLRHWHVALQLLEEHYLVRQAIIDRLTNRGNNLLDCSLYLNASNYYWVGHSLGCKYIILLEILNDGWAKVQANAADMQLERSQLEQIELGLQRVALKLESIQQKIQASTGQVVDYGQPSIHDEASLLIAPVIADLDAAIPLRSLRHGFEKWGLKVFPTIEQTYGLITKSDSFNLMEMIQFQDDTIAKPTCIHFAQSLNESCMGMLNGKHLEPVGMRIGHYVADFNPLDKFIQSIASRQLETVAIAKLAMLKKRCTPAPLGSPGSTTPYFWVG